MTTKSFVRSIMWNCNSPHAVRMYCADGSPKLQNKRIKASSIQ